MTTSETVTETITIEEKKRFSQSKIWQLQRDFFTRQGTKAWSEGFVPHYITSNPFIARRYAEIIFAHIRDLISVKGKPAVFDTTHPIYIVELGAGSGRFSFYFLKSFFSLMDQSAFSKVQVKYVMTDFVSSTIEDWKAHPQLKNWVQKNRLDFSTFDALKDQDFKLAVSGQVLSAETIKNPLIVIANYFFDTLPTDIFSIQNGKLSEALVSINIPKEKSNVGESELIQHISLKYDYEEVDENYYNLKEFNKILADYKKFLPDTCLNFPVGSLYCLKTLNSISNNRLLILTADKGVHLETDLLFQREPYVALHGGCFSLTLNYHALGQYVVHNGGSFLTTTYNHSSIDICLMLTGSQPQDFVETRLAYRLAVEEGSPDDFFALMSGMNAQLKTYSLSQIISLMRFSGWDSSILIYNFNAILDKTDKIPDFLRQEVYFATHKLWDNYFYIGEETDICLYIGSILSALRYYDEAIGFYEQSIKMKGKNAPAFYNISLCYYDLRQLEKCQEMLEETLVADTYFEPARALKIKISEEMKRKVEVSEHAL